MKKLIILALSLLLATAIFAETANTNQVVLEEQTELSLLQRVEQWYSDNMNYTTIALLMTVESSFIPFPSEIVVPPAAYIASQPNSHLNIYLVVLFATIGAVLGALINYFLAIYLGRPIIYKLADSRMGHFLLLSKDKILKAEVYFNRRGKISTFVGRLIPGIRQLISIPAGLARMNIPSFLLFTFIGAGIWNAILAFVGYIAHGQQDLINRYSHELSYVFLGLIALFIAYVVIKQLVRKDRKVLNK
ncbi:MAG: DedA family protein [Bacteroidales bacterium]|nr:DedA family protein [Bacteroidales bacterium]